MKNRILIIVGLFVLCAGGILLTQFVLDKQIPKGDPEFQQRPASPEEAHTMPSGNADGL